MAQDPHDIPDVKKLMRMQSYLTMMAWLALEKELRTLEGQQAYSDEENNFIVGMCEEATKMYENIDQFVEDILNDHAGMVLAQAAMGPHIRKMGGDV